MKKFSIDSAQAAIRKAIERRNEFISSSSMTNCWRLFAGEKEGTSGWLADQWGDFISVTVQNSKFQGTWEEAVLLARELRATMGAKFLVVSLTETDRSRALGGTFQRYEEGAASEEWNVMENSARFIIRASEPFSVGLFLDQRENRKWIGPMARGKGHLNLFAYTCAFGVVSALNGAGQTINVDLSKKYLQWGRRNYEANQLDISSHQFIATDARQFVRRMKKSGRKFGLITIDPPTFSRSSEGGVFQVKRDLFPLAHEACECLEDGGSLMISSNCFQWLTSDFERDCMELAQSQKLKRVPLPEPSLDISFELHPILGALFKKE